MRKPFAITLEVGSSRPTRPAAWRTERPVYVHRLPPCNHACPAGEDIQRWLYLAEYGSYETAWRESCGSTRFPAVMGRICFHPCQTACNRANIDEAVGINAMERFLGDRALAEGWLPDSLPPPPGAASWWSDPGPAGLTAAYHLRRLGHDVALVEAHRARRDDALRNTCLPAATGSGGGRDRAHRRPRRRDPLWTPVDDLEPPSGPTDLTPPSWPWALSAVGTLDIPAGDSSRILDAVDLLR